MGSIVTLDALNEETELAPTQANFPALQHLFKCTETSGSSVLDSINSVEMPAGTIVGDGNKVSTGVQASAALLAGSWQNPEAKNIVVMTFNELWYDGCAFKVGNGGGATAGQPGFGSGGGAWALSDGTTSGQDAAGAIQSALGATMMIYKHNTSIKASWSAAATGAIQDNGATAIATHDLTGQTIAAEGQFQALGLGVIYGVAIFYFTTLPNDTDAALLWMQNEWCNNGNKVIWPGWKGRT